MSNIKEAAAEYVAPNTQNISELSEVLVSAEITEAEYERKEPKEGEEAKFTVNEIEVDEVKYRVPNSVLGQLKTQLAEKPDAEKFKVVKEGEGLNTKYTVVMLWTTKISSGNYPWLFIFDTWGILLWTNKKH